jgi:hypothetical protein
MRVRRSSWELSSFRGQRGTALRTRSPARFVPVSNLHNARDWYCHVLGVPADGEILHDHLYVLPMHGTSLILDSKSYSVNAVFQVPALALNTADIHAAHQHMQGKSAEVMDVQFDKWFTFKDPDGRALMICQS